MVINKIVFTSPQAMVEFSGEKIKPWSPSQLFLGSSCNASPLGRSIV